MSQTAVFIIALFSSAHANQIALRSNELVDAEEAGGYGGPGIAPQNYRSFTDTESGVTDRDDGNLMTSGSDIMHPGAQGVTSEQLEQQIYKAKQVLRHARETKDRTLQRLQMTKMMYEQPQVPWYQTLGPGKIISSGFTASIGYTMFFQRFEDYRLRRLAVGGSFLLSLIYCVAVRSSNGNKRKRRRRKMSNKILLSN